MNDYDVHAGVQVLATLAGLEISSSHPEARMMGGGEMVDEAREQAEADRTAKRYFKICTWKTTYGLCLSKTDKTW